MNKNVDATKGCRKMKVINVDHDSQALAFDNGTKLYAVHKRDCCERHDISLNDLTIDDFDGLEFDQANMVRPIPGYGIELVPLVGWPVRIPGYGSNNGYYSTNLTLVIESADRGTKTTIDISNCQQIGG